MCTTRQWSIFLPMLVCHGIGARAASTGHCQNTKIRSKECKEWTRVSDYNENDRRGDGALKNRYVPFYIGSWLCKKLTARQDLSPFFPSPISLAPSQSTISLSFRVLHIMLTTKVPCHGCGRYFAPRGLSQHVSKTQDPHCRSALRTSQGQTGSFSI